MSTDSGPNLDRLQASADAAVSGIHDGATLLIGGFAGHAEPETLLGAVISSGVRNLTVVCQGSGHLVPGRTGIASAVEAGSIRRMISPLPSTLARMAP